MTTPNANHTRLDMLMRNYVNLPADVQATVDEAVRQEAAALTEARAGRVLRGPRERNRREIYKTTTFS